MEPFVDPDLRSIDPPPFDDPAERYINESDIPKDCLEPISSEANPEDTDLNPVSIETPFPTASKRKRVKQRIRP